MKIDITFTGRYKSLTHIKWDDIPKLCIITGPNGSGKTQLLELIYHSLVPNPNVKIDGKLQIEPVSFEFDEVVYLKGDWGVVNLNPIDIATIQAQHKNLFANAFTNFDDPRKTNNNNYYRETQAKKIEYDAFTKSLGKPYRHSVTYAEFSERYPKNQIKSDTPIHKQINDVFFQYRVAQVERASDGLTPDEIIKEIGLPPWTVLREIIKASKLPFEISDASKTSLWNSFELKLVHTVTQQEISFIDLSSGEKILLSLLFYLYQSRAKNVFPNLILLDEPDAHLHPSLTQQFLNVIKDVFVGQFGIQVIMTTHSPSTVVLSPLETIFEMSINEPRIRPSPSKNHSVTLLTAGLVYVGDSTRYFLVEDQSDVEFYTFVNNQLVAEGTIGSDIPLVFIRASTNDTSGGKTVVKGWIDKLSSSGLTGIIRGLIDKDSGNTIGNGIYTIDRYCIENYFIDPLVIFAGLLDNNIDFSFTGMTLSMGEEYKLKSQPAESLQTVVDSICFRLAHEMPNHFTHFETTGVPVKYTTGLVLTVPQWLLDCSGKIILNTICNKVFGSKIGHGSLLRAFKRLNLMPQDLADKMYALQYCA